MSCSREGGERISRAENLLRLPPATALSVGRAAQCLLGRATVINDREGRWGYHDVRCYRRRRRAATAGCWLRMPVLVPENQSGSRIL